MNVALRPELHLLSICTGGGGLDLGIELAIPGARSVCMVERESFAIAHLVSAMEEGFLAPAPVWSDARTFDGRAWRGCVDGLVGGIPCQPHSVAGKRLGQGDERDLWSDARRIIVQARPWFVLIENVGGMLTSSDPALDPGAKRVWRDLQRLGFEVEGGLFTASEVGAPHERERVFILAVAEDIGHSGTGGARGGRPGPSDGLSELADASSAGRGQPWGGPGPSWRSGEARRIQPRRLGGETRRDDVADASDGGLGRSTAAEVEDGPRESIGGDAGLVAGRSEGPRLNVADASGEGPQGSEQRGAPREVVGLAASRSTPELRGARLVDPEVERRGEGRSEPEFRSGRSAAGGAGTTVVDALSGRHDGESEVEVGGSIGRAAAQRTSGGGDAVGDASVRDGASAGESETHHSAARERQYRGPDCGTFPPGPSDLDRWRSVLAYSPDLEPAVRRMADGVAARVDLAGPHAARVERLRMLGNGVVPLQAAYALRTLASRLAARSPGAARLVRMMDES